MESIYLALIVAGSAMLSPLFLALLTSRNARKLKELDWERQDEVAARMHNQLSVIHKLVNSTLTTALQGRLDTNRKNIVLMRRIIELNLAQGIDPSEAALAEIETGEKDVSDLEMEITDRLKQAKFAQKEE